MANNMNMQMHLPTNWSDWEGEIQVPDLTYEQYMSEVMSLQPKKRKAWKQTLVDKNGTKTRCMYRDGKIYNYSLLLQAGWHRTRNTG